MDFRCVYFKVWCSKAVLMVITGKTCSYEIKILVLAGHRTDCVASLAAIHDLFIHSDGSTLVLRSTAMFGIISMLTNIYTYLLVYLGYGDSAT